MNDKSRSENERLELIRGHAWRYFEYHANQRILLFRFFILFISLTSGGAVFFLKEYPTCGKVDEVCGVILSIVILLVIVVFYYLDKRNRNLVHLAESGLQQFEWECFKPDDIGSASPKDFIDKYPDFAVFIKERKHQPIARHTFLFRVIYGVSFILAMLLLLYSLMYLFCPEYSSESSCENSMLHKYEVKHILMKK